MLTCHVSCGIILFIFFQNYCLWHTKILAFTSYELVSFYLFSIYMGCKNVKVDIPKTMWNVILQCLINKPLLLKMWSVDQPLLCLLELHREIRSMCQDVINSFVNHTIPAAGFMLLLGSCWHSSRRNPGSVWVCTPAHVPSLLVDPHSKLYL